MANKNIAQQTKILIVDDQEGIPETMGAILENEGYEVHTLNSGYEAIEKVKQVSFDIAFLDIKMPGINGVETFKEIKKISPETTVIMMTAYAVEDLIKEALEEGAYACIYKPFDIEKIIEIIQNVKDKTVVLVVDDDPNICELFNLRLSEKGYKVVSVNNGEDAIRLIKRKPVDVVLLDVVMPDIDGIETLKRIKEITKEELPEVIMMSSYEVGEKVQQAMNIGAKKFLKKPIPVDILQKNIKELLPERKIEEKYSVLIVDDDISLCKILSDILTDAGYDVKIATNGAEAIEYIKGNYHKIILLDIKLPDISGIEVYNKIKKIKPEVGIIMMTGFSDDETIVEAIKRGEYICLYKPFSSEKMLEIIKKISK